MRVKKLRLKTAGPCFGDHIIPYHKAKMLYLSNLEKNFFRIAGALKLHFFRVQRPDYQDNSSNLTNKATVCSSIRRHPPKRANGIAVFQGSPIRYNSCSC